MAKEKTKKRLTPAQQQFGNQNAKGCTTSGAPRTVSYTEQEMIVLGQEMVAWVIKNKPIHLSMWYTQHKDFTDKQWDAFIKRPEFLHYYTKALKLVGYSYLDKDSQVDVRLKDRWQRVYFKDLKKQEDEDADADLERKKQEVSSIPPNDKLKDLEHENMILKAKIDELNANKSKAE